MQRFVLLILFLLSLKVVSAQTAERKIIIEHGTYYFTTIDEEYQLATLHSGRVNDLLGYEHLLAVPAGRNYNEPINPFSWDINNGRIYGVSFLDNPLNDRNEALKRVYISSLKPWSDSVTIEKVLMLSTEENTFTMNDPYLFIKRRSKILDHFFFDGIALNDSEYVMLITNNGELSYWHNQNEFWTHGDVFQFKMDGPFSLFELGGKMYLFMEDGSLYLVTKDHLPALVKAVPAKDSIIIEDRDNQKIYTINTADLEKQFSLSDLIRKKATRIL